MQSNGKKNRDRRKKINQKNKSSKNIVSEKKRKRMEKSLSNAKTNNRFHSFHGNRILPWFWNWWGYLATPFDATCIVEINRPTEISVGVP